MKHGNITEFEANLDESLVKIAETILQAIRRSHIKKEDGKTAEVGEDDYHLIMAGTRKTSYEKLILGNLNVDWQSTDGKQFNVQPETTIRVICKRSCYQTARRRRTTNERRRKTNMGQG